MTDLLSIFIVAFWISVCVWCTPFEEEIRRVGKYAFCFTLGGVVAILLSIFITSYGG
jgi:hypothetical protein